MSMDLGRIANITNITGEDFTHAYGGQPFTVKAGETLMFPFDLARHLSKHLARKILLSTTPHDPKNDRPIFSKETEDSLVLKIMGQEMRMPVSPQLSQAEMLNARVRELNENKPENAPTGERTKADVIAELEKAGLPVDKRNSMASLEEQLAKHKASSV